MPGIGNNLYPPIVSTYMPAFIRISGCKIYFSLSNYNNLTDIKYVQVIVNNQNDNSSALDGDKYPTNVKIIKKDQIYRNENLADDAKYFIRIDPEDMIDGKFAINKRYKIQLRLVSNEASDYDESKAASWLVNNEPYFSEWSTVCLIKAIVQPKIDLLGFEDANDKTVTIITNAMTNLVGELYFDKNDPEADQEKEHLEYYRFKIINEDKNESIYDTGKVFTNKSNPNQINYTLKRVLEDAIKHRVELYYGTNNGYEDKKSYLFSIVQGGIGDLNAILTATVEEENGRIRLDLIGKISEPFLGNITIRRTSNQSDFQIWEDVHTTVINNGSSLRYVWYDYTIESGELYRYCAQRRDSRGNRGPVIYSASNLIAEFDSVFLVNEDMQLNIKFDANISSFRTTLSESRTETIGSKYPHFRRNGNISYRQFPISGLITSFCDSYEVKLDKDQSTLFQHNEEENKLFPDSLSSRGELDTKYKDYDTKLFLDRDTIYGNYREIYDLYNEQNGINKYTDIIFEKRFRDKIMEFLYSNKVKLFKSNTEGNILIKLMDINFTPNHSLGRMLYSFSATAYEIDECNIDNFDRYGIQTIGDYSRDLIYRFERIGQIQDIISKNTNILNILFNKYKNVVNTGYVLDEDSYYLKWARITFNSKPYLIYSSGNSIRPLESGEIPNEDTILGYIVNINGINILVGSRGYYELLDEDTTVTSLSFPVDTDATIDYTINLEQKEDISSVASRIYNFIKIGQIYGKFEPFESVYQKIYIKYLIDHPKYYQKMTVINSMSIEADNGVIVYIKDSYDDNYYRHQVGPTCILNFKDDEATISQFYFYGIHLNKRTDSQIARENEWIYIGVASSIEAIKRPIYNGVYIIDGQSYIYYRGKWYEFSIDPEDEHYGDIQCSVEAIVDYTYELVKGEY